MAAHLGIVISPAYVDVLFKARVDPSAIQPRGAHVANGSAAPEVALALAVVLLAERVPDAEKVMAPETDAETVLLAVPDAVEATVLETAEVLGFGAVAASWVAL